MLRYGQWFSCDSITTAPPPTMVSAINKDKDTVWMIHSMTETITFPFMASYNCQCTIYIVLLNNGTSITWILATGFKNSKQSDKKKCPAFRFLCLYVCQYCLMTTFH